MKTRFLTTVLFALCMALLLNGLNAQDAKVKIITKDNGNVDVKVFESKEELDDETKQLLEEKGISLEDLKNDFKSEYKVKIINDSGETETYEWTGDSEIPDELKGRVKMKDKKGKRVLVIGEDGIENINVDIEEIIDNSNSSEKRVKVKILDEDGKAKVMQWNGEGDMPEEMEELLAQLENECDKEMELGSIEEDFMIGDGFVIFNHSEGNENKAQLGVYVESADDGVKVTGFLDDSNAKKSGVRKNDVIQYIDKVPINEVEELIDYIAEKEVGDIVELTLLRNEGFQKIDVKLGERKVGIKIKSVECVIDEVINKEETQMEESFVAPKNTLKLKGYNVFPNPSSGLINLEFEAKRSATIIQIHDAMGRNIYKEVIDDFEGNYSKQIDLRDESISGPVYVSIIQNQKVYTDQVIFN